MTQYRPDIDGLRAVAISSVVLFHAFPETFTGGFVGVDIFFIISGFLITSIIASDIASGTFTLRGFYIKRVNRIFPALALTFATFLIAGWMLLLPDEFKALGKHVAGGAGFIANVLLFKEDGYFTTASNLKPLLHLWSLGIEEQFYFVWPVLLMFTYRRKKIFFSLVALLFLGSLTLNLVRTFTHPAESFFLLHTRLWELLLGAFLALLRAPALTRNVANALSFLGLIFCLVPIYFLNEQQAFPGYWALLPTLGASAIVLAGPTAWVNQHLLSKRFIVYLGLISYPLYLWHWPLFSFAHITLITLPLETRVALLGLSIFLSVLTFEALEKPLRKWTTNKQKLTLVLCTLMLILGGVGQLIKKEKILSSTHTSELEAILAKKEDWNFPRGPRTEIGHGTEWIVFIGDSHIQQYYPRIKALLQEKQKAFFVTGGSCAPILGLRDPRPQTLTCLSVIPQAIELASDPRIKKVVLGAAWFEKFATGSPFFITIDDQRFSTAFNAEGFEIALKEFARMITTFRTQNKHVYVVLDVPTGQAFNPTSFISRQGFSIKVEPTTFLRSELEGQQATSTRLREIAEAAGAEVIDPVKALCDETICSTTDTNGMPRYKDSTHLSATFTESQVHYLDRVISD